MKKRSNKSGAFGRSVPPVREVAPITSTVDPHRISKRFLIVAAALAAWILLEAAIGESGGKWRRHSVDRVQHLGYLVIPAVIGGIGFILRASEKAD